MPILSAASESALTNWCSETCNRYTQDPETLTEFIVSTIKSLPAEDIEETLKLELRDFLDDHTDQFVADCVRLHLTPAKNEGAAVVNFEDSSSDEDVETTAVAATAAPFKPTASKERPLPAFLKAVAPNVRQVSADNNKGGSGGNNPSKVGGGNPFQQNSKDFGEEFAQFNQGKSRDSKRRRWEEDDDGRERNERNVRPRRGEDPGSVKKGVQGAVTFKHANFVIINTDIYCERELVERAGAWPLRHKENVVVDIVKTPKQKNPWKAVAFEKRHSSSMPRYDDEGDSRRNHRGVERFDRGGRGGPRGGRRYEDAEDFAPNSAPQSRGNRTWKAEGEAAGEDHPPPKPKPKKTFEVVDTASLLEERKKQKRATLTSQKNIHTKKINLLSSQMSELRKMLKGLGEDGGKMEIMLMKKMTTLAAEMKASEQKVQEAEKGLGSGP